ncbi:hypothetical protein [Streptomyces erythrochromogenes]|uniref:hypothetical protein n=1 Tax=Streptomyces erythrochromogenes TaxID=285574 RepID=UPI0036F92D2C
MLEHILSAEFVGAWQLRSQLDRTEVVALWGPDSVSVDLRFVWTDRRATLAALEFAWVTDEMPTSLPAVVDGRLSRPA